MKISQSAQTSGYINRTTWMAGHHTKTANYTHSDWQLAFIASIFLLTFQVSEVSKSDYSLPWSSAMVLNVNQVITDSQTMNSSYMTITVLHIDKWYRTKSHCIIPVTINNQENLHTLFLKVKLWEDYIRKCADSLHVKYTYKRKKKRWSSTKEICLMIFKS